MYEVSYINVFPGICKVLAAIHCTSNMYEVSYINVFVKYPLLYIVQAI